MPDRKDGNDRNDHDTERADTTYSGAFGERNRNTPGRTPRELGLDPEEMRAHDLVGETQSDRTSENIPRTGMEGPGDRTNPPETEQVDGSGEGGVSMSGGRAGGARGHGGTSDAGAGGPDGEARGGPGEYKGTSRFDLDHGSTS